MVDGVESPVQGLRFRSNAGHAVATVVDWRDLAPPAAARHWAEYRSAAELAYDWMENDAVARVQALFERDPALTSFVPEWAVIERKTRFDDIRGGPRNHDLLVVGRSAHATVAVGVEGKADEPFGLPLDEHVAHARKTQPRTRAPERLDRLTRALLGSTLGEEPSLHVLGYQLLSALAGTLVEARKATASVAVLLVHEFETPLTRRDLHQRNAAVLDAFVTRLGGAPGTERGDAWLAGPFRAPGNDFIPSDIAFFIAKLTTKVAKREQAVPALRPVVPAGVAASPRPATLSAAPPKSIPSTLMDILYDEVHALAGVRREASLQAAQLELAHAWLQEPDRLAYAFAESVRQFSAYDNRGEPFHPPRPDPHLATRAVSSLAATNDIAALAQRQGECDAGELTFRYVDREVVPSRTTGGATFTDGRTAKGYRSLDLLLIDSADGTPIVAEVKVGGDQHPFYALVQLLMLGAQLATANQLERLARHYPGAFAATDRIDLYMLLAGQRSHGTYRGELGQAAHDLSAALMRRLAVTRHVRRIACVDLTLTGERLDFETRFAFESEASE